jgi:hypothetical protein
MLNFLNGSFLELQLALLTLKYYTHFKAATFRLWFSLSLYLPLVLIYFNIFLFALLPRKPCKKNTCKIGKSIKEKIAGKYTGKKNLKKANK